jgi:hypothetical protein
MTLVVEQYNREGVLITRREVGSRKGNYCEDIQEQLEALDVGPGHVIKIVPGIPKFGFLEKLACARRELALRKNVYSKWVASGRMKPDDAAREIELMQGIVDDYTALLGGDTLQPA